MADATVTKLERVAGRDVGIFTVITTWEGLNTESLLQRTMSAVSTSSLASWLAGPVDEYFQEEIIDRFAFGGDNKSGDWAPLTETTQRIRDAMGFPADDPINERTGELLEFVVTSREYHTGEESAMMQIPGDPDSAALEAKLLHAQQGTTENPLFPGSVTPPRPVVAADATDMEVLLKMLQMHVMETIARGL